MRMAQIPGIRFVAAQQILAEVGPDASAFPSAAQFASWMGACPGASGKRALTKAASAPTGTGYLRRTLCQAAQAAVRTQNSRFQAIFRRLQRIARELRPLVIPSRSLPHPRAYRYTFDRSADES